MQDSLPSLQTQVSEIRVRYGIPALAAVTLNSQQFIQSAIDGVRVQGTDNAATLEDYFHIGSCGKSVLAVAAGRQVEQGHIGWRSKLLDVLPDIALDARPEYADVTLEDLLLCRAGLPPYTSGDEPFPELNPMSDTLRLDFIRYLVAHYPPAPHDARGRFQHLYSNASYTAVACMLERVSGKSWHALMRYTLTEGMGFNVLFGWPNQLEEEGSDQPWGHAPEGDALRPYPPDDPYALSILIAPAGDLSMTPLEYAGYVQRHLQGLRGIGNYLTSRTYRYIHHARKGFALGVGNGRYQGKNVSQFDGSAGTFYCHTIVVPGDDFAFVIMANAGGEQAQHGIYELSARIMRGASRPWWRRWN